MIDSLPHDMVTLCHVGRIIEAGYEYGALLQYVEVVLELQG